MKILLICNKSPWPPREGGPIAMNAMIEGLLEAGHQVKVLAINSNKYFVDLKSIPEDYKEKTRIELVYTDLKIKLADAFLNLFSTKSYHVQRFITRELRSTIERILNEEEFDIIQLETLFVTPYLDVIRRMSKAPVFLRAHNIEHFIWKRLYEREKNPIRKFYLKHLFKTLSQYETETVKNIDGVIAITSVDASFYAKLLPPDRVISIPFGISGKQITNITRIPLSDFDNNIFHIGSMNWLPNQEGIKWFIKEVWPELKKNNPKLLLHLAGREMPEWLNNSHEQDIIIDGEVADSIQYMRKHRLMIVPLFSGSGIRIKIIEGMMAGCVVISTAIGAEGIDYVDGESILIANGKHDFINAISRILQDKTFAEKIGKAASQLITEKHNNLLLIKRLETFYQHYTN
ncbi:MAG TPA: glycosyltransferase family 4 protein [Lentimicrobium sp.]|nr:glycosyltransferase family 4 protein [Lentimicrobium sp.]